MGGKRKRELELEIGGERKERERRRAYVPGTRAPVFMNGTHYRCDFLVVVKRKGVGTKKNFG